MVRALGVHAEGDVMRQAVDDLFESLEILGHLCQAVAFAGEGNDAQPAQDFGRFGVLEDVRTGAEAD